MVKSRQKAQVDKGLKSIADAEDKISGIDKFQNFFPQIGFHANRLDDTCTVIVSPTESAAEYHNLKILQFDGSVNQSVDMNTAGAAPESFKA